MSLCIESTPAMQHCKREIMISPLIASTALRQRIHFLPLGIIFCICFFSAAPSAQAQLAAFQDDRDIITPSFKYDVIHAKNIASIFIQIEEKPDGKMIRDDGIVQYYKFDTTSRLIQSYYTIKTGSNTWDTIRAQYYYDKDNRLLTKRINEGVFYDTWYYVWYADNNLKKEAHVHENPGTSGGQPFYIGEQKVISCDSFAYSIFPKQIQRFGYNEENTIYEKTITQYDDNKRMIERYSHYQVGWLYSQIDLKYDSANHISEYSISGNVNGEVHKTIRLSYDKSGNVLSEKIFESGKQTNEIEFLCDKTTGLITDKLDRDLKKGLIEIWKFNYTFFDKDIILDSQ